MQSLKFFGAVTFAVGSFSLSNPYQYPNMLLMGQRSLPEPSPSPSSSPSSSPGDVPVGTASRGDCDGITIMLSYAGISNSSIQIRVVYPSPTEKNNFSGRLTVYPLQSDDSIPGESIRLPVTSNEILPVLIPSQFQSGQDYEWIFEVFCPTDNSSILIRGMSE